MDHHHEVSVISQLLVLLDGIEARGRVAVIATTNRIEAVDHAIRRPGRFDYHIEIRQPDEKGRKAILDAHLRKLKVAPGCDVARIACQTEGFSGAALAALCREAGLAAIRRGMSKGTPPKNTAIYQEDLHAAVQAMRTKRTGLDSDR
jgi:transitional endoplasmic reticulum ATPase